MSEKLAISGGTPVLQRSDYVDWPIITDDDRRLINEVLDTGIFGGGTAPLPQSDLEVATPLVYYHLNKIGPNPSLKT